MHESRGLGDVYKRQGVLRADWAPLLPMLRSESTTRPARAGAFHETMAQTIVAQARAVAKRGGVDAIGFSGGVFQNRLLSERAAYLLRQAGFDVRLHRDIPANDGGLSIGQVIEAAAMMRVNSPDC